MLLEQIRSDMITAKKARETAKARSLATLLGEAQMVGKTKGNRETTDEEVVQVVKKFLKGIVECESLRSNSEMSEQTYNEIKLFKGYLPTQLTEEQMTSEIKLIIDEAGLSAPKQMGIVMKTMNEKFPGRFDGATASHIARLILSESK